MKPLLIVALLSLPLLGIFVFYQKENSVQDKPAARPIATTTALKSADDKKTATYHAPQESGVMTEDAKKQMSGMKEKTNFLGNSAAILMTEEVQRGMVNKAVSVWEQAYQPLFSKWGTTDADKRAVLDIVRRREARLISMRVAAQKKGIDAMSEAKRFIESERAGYAREISVFLDAEKVRELTELENREYSKFRTRGPARD